MTRPTFHQLLTKALHEAQATMTRSYLEPTNTHEDQGLDSVRLWLSGFLTRDDFFSNPPPQLQDLHSALMCAVMELKLNLDPQLSYLISSASGSSYNFEFLVPATFFSTRQLDLEYIESIREPGIRSLNRGDVMRFLQQAKFELEWTKNETRRLEVHLDVAKTLIEAKLRTSFVYRATPRGEGVMGKYAVVPNVAEDEAVLRSCVESDEGMLDNEEYAERRVRSRTPEPGEISRYDDDYEFAEETEEGVSDEEEEEGKENVGEEEEEQFKVEIRPKKKARLEEEESGRNDSVIAVSWGGLRLQPRSPDL